MLSKDKLLKCCDCESFFVFSAGEQEFFSVRGLMNEPKRCPNCRVLLRVNRNGRDANSTAMVPCADCDAATRVPFQPTGRKPVYCSHCFRMRLIAQNGGQRRGDLVAI